MNRHIFPDTKMIKSSQPETTVLLQLQSPVIQWIFIIMLIAIVILFPERPAWGGDVL